jgi:phosphatidylserine decarboxylase
MRLTGYGAREWGGGGVLALLALGGAAYLYLKVDQTAGIVVASVVALVYFCVAAFFRDPKRRVPEEPTVLVSPADGVIRDIELLKSEDENEFFDGNGVVRVGIFLSVLDVHLNRAPCEMEVEKRFYKEGAFHDARNPKASKENESMTVFCRGKIEDSEFPMIIRQISGAIARRIVCQADSGKSYSKGERFGMIKFGSRTELFLPAESWMRVEVKVGDRVFAGETVVAKVVAKGDGAEEEEGKGEGS